MNEKERRLLIEILEHFHAICEDLSTGNRVANQLTFVNKEIGILQGMFNSDDRITVETRN